MSDRAIGDQAMGDQAMGEEAMSPDGIGAEPIRRLLVANRGEIAVRVFETARSMGITCIAVYSDPDRGARHVRESDLAVHLPGTTSLETYLDIDQILAAARRSDADAIHPGYGFLAENAEFAQAVAAAGLRWVGPRPDSIRQMALKVQAKRLADAAGVPLIPGAEIADATSPDARSRIRDSAAAVGYPVMVKASAGGGGKGMRVVHGPDGLESAVEGARREAQSSFNDPTVFLERYLPRARHVEVQVFGDEHGNHLHLHDRECSIQRRHQKVIEEAPSPGVTVATRRDMLASAVDLARWIDYVGAGTVEFLVSGDGDDQEFFFLEMNTRLQVEHRVTEMITGIDLVRWQLLVAQGHSLQGAEQDISCQGHAIEARLYAEDPTRDHLPGAGTIDEFVIDGSSGALVDRGFGSGDPVSPLYDPLLAKVVTHGADRDQAISSLVSCLERSTVSGLPTNRGLLVAVLSSFAFRIADTTTAFLDEHADLFTGVRSDPGKQAPEPLLAAAFHYLGESAEHVGWSLDPHSPPLHSEPVPPRYRNVAGTPGFVGLLADVPGAEPRFVLLDRVRGDEWDVALALGEHPYRAPSRSLGRVRVTRPTDDSLAGEQLLIERDGLTTRWTVESVTDRVLVSGEGVTHAFVRFDHRARSSGEAGTSGPVSPVPGTVAHVPIEVGQRVSAGDTLIVLEAMKMEHTITADADGLVSEVLVRPGQSVDAHQALLVLADDEER